MIKGAKHSKITIDKMKKNHKGMSGLHHSEDTKNKMRNNDNNGWVKSGQRISILTEFKKGEYRIPWNKGIKWNDRIGKNHPNWKGGITPDDKKIRQSSEYKLWREAVFKRDDYTCKKYRIKGGKLHPHHIKNFKTYPELRFDINNGITLSEKAHKEFHKKYGRVNNNEEQIIEFLCL